MASFKHAVWLLPLLQGIRAAEGNLNGPPASATVTKYTGFSATLVVPDGSTPVIDLTPIGDSTTVDQSSITPSPDPTSAPPGSHLVTLSTSVTLPPGSNGVVHFSPANTGSSSATVTSATASVNSAAPVLSLAAIAAALSKSRSSRAKDATKTPQVGPQASVTPPAVAPGSGAARVSPALKGTNRASSQPGSPPAKQTQLVNGPTTLSTVAIHSAHSSADSSLDDERSTQAPNGTPESSKVDSASTSTTSASSSESAAPTSGVYLVYVSVTDDKPGKWKLFGVDKNIDEKPDFCKLGTMEEWAAAENTNRKKTELPEKHEFSSMKGCTYSPEPAPAGKIECANDLAECITTFFTYKKDQKCGSDSNEVLTPVVFCGFSADTKKTKLPV